MAFRERTFISGGEVMKLKLTFPVTLIHYDEEEKQSFSSRFPKAKVHGTTKIGDLGHGRRAENRYTVRIMTDSDVPVSCGDEIYCELFKKNLTVVGIADNRRGSGRIHHFKLLVE